jgi:type VI secretion system ImpA/VasJ family protein
MAEACGRAWMDLQRYIVKALDEWGCPDIASAVRSELRALLADLPELPGWTFDDDTPVANAETQLWLAQICKTCDTDGELREKPAPAQPPQPEAPPDIYALATQKVRSGRVDDAIEMLAQDIALQQSGRGRFQSKVQFAQLCLASGREHLALPILEELVETIDHHLLDSWEPPESIAHALTLLYRCLDKTNGEPALKQKIYARICRLDPVQAMTFCR